MNSLELPDDARLLAPLMDLGVECEGLWQPDELAAILQHQLAAPVEFPRDVWREQTALPIQAMCSAADPPIASFGDLFAHPRPPRELLQMTKDYAKVCRARGAGPIPAEIATMLYLVSIAVAFTTRGERISGLESQGLSHALTWAVAQTWIDAPLRRLLTTARIALGSPEGAADA